jgi:hemolysin activation/secretion protein
VLTRAIVPPQKLTTDGSIVRIQVIEGWINKVEWPQKLARYRNFFTNYTAKIIGDRPANIRTIERYLLLAGDLPGFKISTTLRASENEVGASTLIIDVTEKPIDANARIDNRGTQSRGPYQFLSSATFNNVIHQHEAFSLTWAGTAQLQELEYFAGSYRQVLTSEGFSLFANTSYTWGKPRTIRFQTLDYKTNGTNIEAGFSQPFIRAREKNLTLSGLAFLSDNHSDILSAPFNDDRLRGLRLKADADVADALIGKLQCRRPRELFFKGANDAQSYIGDGNDDRITGERATPNSNHIPDGTASDIDTAVVDSLKVLDPKQPIREANIEQLPAIVRFRGKSIP